MDLTNPKLLLWLGFGLGLSTILGALAFEHIGGYEPCALCLQQRWPYHAALPILALLILVPSLLNGKYGRYLILWIIGSFLYGAYLGGYHAGAEWGFWPGPQSCGTSNGSLNVGDLGAGLNEERIISCTEVQWRFFGTLSFAGFNAIFSVIIVVLTALAWVHRRNMPVSEPDSLWKEGEGRQD